MSLKWVTLNRTNNRQMYFSKLLVVTCNINCTVLGAAVAYIDGKFEHLKSPNKLGNYNE